MQTHHFKSPHPNYYYYSGSEGNGINWDDGFIENSQLHTVLDESTKNFAHVYSYGDEACNFLQNLLQVPIHDLQTLMCPEPHKLHSDYTCYLTCHKNYDLRCAMKGTCPAYVVRIPSSNETIFQVPERYVTTHRILFVGDNANVKDDID
jgi:hypothetical protein